MTVRSAGPGDRDVVHELYREFFAESPPPPEHDQGIDHELVEVDEILAAGGAWLAESDGEVAGLALARTRTTRVANLTDLYVRPAARRRGLGRDLVATVAAEFAARGATHLDLEADSDNAGTLAFYDRLGFRERWRRMAVETAVLVAGGPEPGETFGSVHVQTDDEGAVERAVAQFLPRLGRSAGTVVTPQRNGWVAIYDELCDREPKLLRRLARELSDRMGAVVLQLGLEEGAVVRYILFDRGRVADEYASVPEYHGPLPPGDVVALQANPTVAQRLAGADPAGVRASARVAVSPRDLPPPHELLAEVAAALGVEGGEHGFAGA